MSGRYFYLLSPGGEHVYAETEIREKARHLYTPVVVIDPEDREQVERLDSAYQNALDSAPQYLGVADVMQTALRSLISPPRPVEPTGLGAVVEDITEKWVAGPGVPGGRRWEPECGGEPRRYVDIAAVKVLSEGVTA